MTPSYHRLEVYILDFEKFGIKELIATLDNIDAFSFKVGDCQSTVIPNWTDDHELNKRNCTLETQRKYFDIKQIGPYVSIPLRPKTELEIENESLKKEIQTLKNKLERIKNII